MKKIIMIISLVLTMVSCTTEEPLCNVTKIYNSKVVYDTQPWFNGNTTYQEELTNVSCSLKNTNEYQFDARTGASITTTITYVYH
jgi:hypothetical protein